MRALKNNFDSSDTASLTDVNDPIYDEKVLNNLLFNDTVKILHIFFNFIIYSQIFSLDCKYKRFI